MVEETPELIDDSFKLNVDLFGNSTLDLLVSPRTSCHEIAQVVFDSPKSQYRTCFHLQFGKERLSPATLLGEIPLLEPESTITAVQGEYTEHSVRIHLVKFREVIGQIASRSLGIDSVSRLAQLMQAETAESKSDTLQWFKDFEFTSKTSSIQDIASRDINQVLPCLSSLGESMWGPVPFNRKMAGDLLYLQAKTLEGNSFEITASVSGFFVNGSSETAFNPKRGPKSKSFVTLVELLQHLSPKFTAAFKSIETRHSSTHAFSQLLSSTPNFAWAVAPKEHTLDAGSSLDAAMVSSDIMETLCARDWNDDFQGSLDLPKEGGNDRITRDQAVFKSHTDFIDAATRGAMAIVNKALSPINPEQPDLSQMFIHNNIFYSQGYDGQDQFDKYGGESAAHVAVSKDIDAIQALNKLDIDCVRTLGTVLIDYKGQRIIAQTIIPGILKKTAEHESAILYGSVDGGDEIFTSEKFQEVVQKVSNALHIESHAVLDSRDEPHTLLTSVDTKGVLGTDSRLYLLDLYRTTPVDCEFLEQVEKEKDENPYPHQMTLIRQELVQIYFHAKFRQSISEYQENVKKLKEEAKLANQPEESVAVPEFQFKVAFNPDAFTHAKLAGTAEEIEESKKNVRQLSGFISNVISQLVLDTVRHVVQVPADSRALTTLFHRRGLNMRYLGKVAGLFDQIAEFPVSMMGDLLKEEMVARACKGILRAFLKVTPIHFVGACISHFFNCLFASEGRDVSVIFTNEHQKLVDQDWQALTTDSLKEMVISLVNQKFRYKMAAPLVSLSVPLLRSVCNKVGIQIEARDYSFGKSNCFQPEDILNIYPILKHALPKAAFAEEALDQGQAAIAQDKKVDGQELVRESLSMHEQIYGPIHPETAKSYGIVAMQNYENEKYDEAIAYQTRAAIVAERTLGLDDAETILQFTNLAYFHFVAGNLDQALLLMKHALTNYRSVYCGRIHPEIVSAFTNCGAMLQKAGEHDLSIKFNQQVVEMNTKMFGSNHPILNSAQESLVNAYCFKGDLRNALASQRQVYKIAKESYGIEDSRTIQSAEMLKGLTTKAVELAIQARSQKSEN